MAETQDYKHIRVTSHEDEVVIYAGKPVSADPGAPQGATVSEPPAPSSDARPVPEPSEAPAGSVAQERDDGYRATTLEDLSSSRMSTTQKVIIVLAALGILAFIVWYVAFAR